MEKKLTAILFTIKKYQRTKCNKKIAGEVGYSKVVARFNSCAT